MKRLISVLLLLILTGPCCRWAGNLYFENQMPGGFSNSFACFDLLAMGVLLYFTFEHTRQYLEHRPTMQALLCLFGLFLTSTVFIYTTAADPVQRIYGPTFLGFGLFLFLLGGLHLRIIERIPRWSMYPGELSYGMYLYHPMIMFLLWPFCLKQNELVSFCCVLAVLIVISAVSFHFFEKPANKLVCKNLK